MAIFKDNKYAMDSVGNSVQELFPGLKFWVFDSEIQIVNNSVR